MGKISPVSIKYMIHANFIADGSLEKPDVIGAIFGQTEGLLGSELEMRELQKEGKIGRIEVNLEKQGKRTVGTIRIPTALDQSETTLLAAAIETIERIGPSDSQIEVEKIEDVRGSKREYIVERAKKLMRELHGANSREILSEIKTSTRTNITEYGEEKLPCGDLTGKEIIVVEGRADVLNLMRNGIKNVIGMNGTKLPESIKALSEQKEITLFVDGDRGGKLIVQNVVDNARIKYIAVAPSGKEVEELTDKEILMALRKRVPVGEFFSREGELAVEDITSRPSYFLKKETDEVNEFNEKLKRLKELSKENEGTRKAIIFDDSLKEIKKVSIRSLGVTLKKIKKAFAIVIDGTATSSAIKAAEDAQCKVISAKNFATTDTKIKLVSF